MTPSTGPGGGRRRDDQRGAIYSAEQQLGRLLDRADRFPLARIGGSTVTLPAERRFADIPSAQRYADAVLALNWVRGAWPESAASPVTVRSRRGASRAHYEPGSATIALPLGSADDRWALRELVLLHEIAHHLGGGDLSHGAAFTGRMLTLVDGVIGAEAAFVLRVLLADQGAAMSPGTVGP